MVGFGEDSDSILQERLMLFFPGRYGRGARQRPAARASQEHAPPRPGPLARERAAIAR